MNDLANFLTEYGAISFIYLERFFMATFTKTAVLLALALSAGSVFAAAKPADQTISTLGGKFSFDLPKAYVADTLPAGKAADGTGIPKVRCTRTKPRKVWSSSPKPCATTG